MPDFGNISLPGAAAAKQALGRSGQTIQIISLPNNLKNVAKALRLAGEITQLSSNGIIRIETPEGPIEAQTRRTNTLQTGQQIDVEIPSGRPPQQATLKPPTIRTPSEQNISPRNITTPNIASSTNQTPRDNYVRPEQNFLKPENIRPTDVQNQRITTPIQTDSIRPAQQTQQPSPLQQDAIVRLLAVPPAQAQKIATEFFQTLNIQPAALTRVPVTGNLIAENIQTQILNSALQIKAPTATPTLPQNPIQNLQIVPTPVLTTNFSQTIPTPQINITPVAAPIPTPQTPIIQTVIPPVQNAVQPLPISALLSPDIAQPLIQNLPVATTASTTTAPIQTTIPTPLQPTHTSLTPLPITFDPKNPTPISNNSVARIDIQIVNIQSPAPVLSAPPSQTSPQTPLQPLIPQTNVAGTTTQITPSQTSQPQPQPIIPATTNFTPPIVNTNNNAVTLTAQVTGFTPQGLPLVTIPTAGRAMPQSFVMQFNSNNLQLGTRLQITTQNPVLTQQAQVLQPSNPLLRGFQWPALSQLHNTLLQLSPQAAASLIRTLPTPTTATQIAPAAMMFIAAVKSGDIAQFIGQNKADMVQRAGRDNILRALSQDTSQATRTTEPSSAGEWRAVPLPMFWEGEIQKVNLYTRHEFQDDNKKDNEGNGQTRFIFDLELSRMGEMQIDGYLKDQRLDLIIRSQNTFSEPMQQTMRQAYSTALDQTALNGELNFQGSTKHWVHVLEQEEQLGVNA